MIEPRAWLSKDGRKSLTSHERKEHDNPTWRWILEKHWSDAEPLVTVADVLAALREPNVAMSSAGAKIFSATPSAYQMNQATAIYHAMLDQFEKANSA